MAFEPKKQPNYQLDRTMLRAKLDTLLTLYGMEGIAEIVTEWSAEKPTKSYGVWSMRQDLTSDDVGALIGREIK